MIKLLLILALTLLTSIAWADEEVSGSDNSKPTTLEYSPGFLKPMVDNPDLTQLTPEEIAARDKAAAFLKNFNINVPDINDPKFKAERQLPHQAKNLVNEVMLKDREEILKFLGVDSTGKRRLYFFVSWSMPIEMLKSYALEAMWSGGVLVFRGIPEGMTLGTYVRQQATALLRDKGASATLELDPRLFDLYHIDSVPTIVYSEAGDPENQQACVQPKNPNGVIARCVEADPSKYWMVKGAVTTDWALREFIANGAKGAEEFHAALASSGKIKPQKDEKDFGIKGYEGDWDAEPTPSELMAQKLAEEQGEFAYKLSNGKTVYGPKGMDVSKLNKLIEDRKKLQTE